MKFPCLLIVEIVYMCTFGYEWVVIDSYTWDEIARKMLFTMNKNNTCPPTTNDRRRKMNWNPIGK